MSDLPPGFRVVGAPQQPPTTPSTDLPPGFRAVTSGQETAAYSGSILPLSRDAQGHVRFDSDAGVLGAIKRAVTLPGDVYTGKVDPMSDEAIGRSAELATLGSPVNPAVRAGDRAVPGALMAMTKEKVKPPTSEALKKAADEGYAEARSMGVDFSSSAVSDLARDLQAALEQDGVLAKLAPKSFRILRDLQNPPADSVAPLASLDAARRAFGHAARDFTNPTEQLAAQRARERLDEFLTGHNPQAVVAGPAAAAGEVIADARGNYAAAMRSDQLTGLGEAAELRADAANSGRNLDNAVRQRIASVLLSPKQAAGFSEAELSQLRRVARGTPASNTARTLGNLLGGGGGLGAGFTGFAGASTGMAAGSPGLTAAGAALPIVGYASKSLANALTKRGLNKADKLTRKRSPLYDLLVSEAQEMPISPERRAALVRALLLSEEQQ